MGALLVTAESDHSCKVFFLKCTTPFSLTNLVECRRKRIPEAVKAIL